MRELCERVNVLLYKLNPRVPVPEYGTSLAACFDLTFAPTGSMYRGYDADNKPFEHFIHNDELWIHPGERVLVPTGLIMKMDMPGKYRKHNYSIRLHARSGLSLKRGLVLANSEGVIDVDYQLEIFALMTNISKVSATIKAGERICQAEIVKNVIAKFHEVDAVPSCHSERAGGFGSTGVST